MLLFLYGQDSFRLHKRWQQLRTGFQQKYDPSGYSTLTLDANTTTLDQLRSRLLANGLFSTKRLVVLKQVFTLSDTVSERLSTILSQIAADTIIICTSDQLPKATSPLKERLLAANRVEEFTLLTPQQLSHWIQTQIAIKQATITPEATALLTQAIGSDLWAMHQTLQQLIHFNKTITGEIVNQFVLSPLDNNIFHLTDALAEQRLKQALQLLHAQLEQAASPFYLITMLARQVSLLLQIKESGMQADAHPYVIKKLQPQAQRFSRDQLVKLYHQLIEMDVALKSSDQDPGLLLDRFILGAI